MAKALRRAAGVLVAGLAGSSLTASIPGCTDRRCEASSQLWGGAPGEGQRIDEDTWQSTPMTGAWLEFPGQKTFFFRYRDVMGHRLPADVHVYVSASPSPNEEGNATNFTTAAGNLATVTVPFPGEVWIRNATCAPYFLRVVVDLYPEPPAPTDADAGDGGGDADIEGGTDAGTDGAVPTDAEAPDEAPSDAGAD